MFLLAVLVMRWSGGKVMVLWVQERLDEFFANSKGASKVMFGDGYEEHYMVFGVRCFSLT
jgi:membrane-bound lytic murein transglycosylase